MKSGEMRGSQATQLTLPGQPRQIQLRRSAKRSNLRATAVIINTFIKYGRKSWLTEIRQRCRRSPLSPFFWRVTGPVVSVMTCPRFRNRDQTIINVRALSTDSTFIQIKEYLWLQTFCLLVGWAIAASVILLLYGAGGGVVFVCLCNRDSHQTLR